MMWMWWGFSVIYYNTDSYIMRPQLIVYILLFCSTFALIFCNRKLPKQAENKYLNLEEGVQYVGMKTCQSCHQDIHASYSHTGMGKSFAPAIIEKSSANFGDHALVYDIVYTPLETDLLKAANARDLAIVDGLDMFIGQAALAFELFFGKTPPMEHDEEVRKLLTK